jgi:hypothetical protein
MERDTRGPENSGVITELGSDDLDQFGRVSESTQTELGANRIDEQIPSTGRTTANNDHFRIQHIHQIGECQAKVVSHLPEGFDGDRVASARGPIDFVGSQRIPVRPAFEA